MNRLKKLIPKKLFLALQPAYHFLLSLTAAVFAVFPSRRLIVIGVTGTAGKTSTVYMIAKMLEVAGYKTGFTSTAVFSDGEREWLNNKKMTMPGRFFIQKMIRRMARNGCRYAVIETTSEGIKQFRHRFINYDTLVFTGLYPEHIESHGSFEKYKEAKGKLFAHLHRFGNKYADGTKKVCHTSTSKGMAKLDLSRIKKTIIVNGDDEQASYFLNFWSEAKAAYSLNSAVDLAALVTGLSSEAAVKEFAFFRGELLVSDATGLELDVSGQRLHLNLLGSFNAYNALAAYSVGIDQGVAVKKIKAGLESVRQLAGKMEMIEAGQDFTAIVDYSFEPKALEKLYDTISVLPHQRLIHVLGSAGGGRDKARRPIMGRLAAENADIIVVTNEDPYDEDPVAIINQVAAGAEMSGKTNGEDLFKILDRTEAIKKAVFLAKKNDIVLLTGKGAEQYICLANGVQEPWDDRRALKQAIGDKLCIDK